MMPSCQMLDEDIMSITLKAKDIGAAGMLGIGWGGVTMFTAQVGEVILMHASNVPRLQDARLRSNLPASRGHEVDRQGNFWGLLASERAISGVHETCALQSLVTNPGLFSFPSITAYLPTWFSSRQSHLLHPPDPPAKRTRVCGEALLKVVPGLCWSGERLTPLPVSPRRCLLPATCA